MKDAHEEINKCLGINIVGITVGALTFVTATAWIEYIRILSDEVYDEIPRDNYNLSYKYLYSAVSFTIISVFIMIIIYAWYRNHNLKLVKSIDDIMIKQ